MHPSFLSLTRFARFELRSKQTNFYGLPERVSARLDVVLFTLRLMATFVFVEEACYLFSLAAFVFIQDQDINRIFGT